MKGAKQLTVFDFTIIMVSLVIGMGIFRTPVNVARATNDIYLFYASWIAGGLVAICGALTYAEIGSRLPVTGGYYRVFSYAYHPSLAFAINCIIIVSNASTLVAVALVGGEYISGVVIPQSQDAAWMLDPSHARFMQNLQAGIAVGSIILFYGINLLGLRMSTQAQNILTVIKIIMVILLISPLFFAAPPVHPDMVQPAASSLSPTFSEYLKGFGVGLVAVNFTYGGYQQTINFGGEVKNPKKTIPRGIFSGILLIIILYLLINYAYVRVIGFDTLRSSQNIAAIMASKIFGIHAERVLSVLLFFSVLAYVNILLMSNPRVMSAMSEDNILPASFKKRNERTGVLTTSLTVFFILCTIIVFWAKKFDTILSFTIFLDCFGMVFSAGSIFLLRKKTAHLNDSGIYTMKLYPLMPVIFIAGYTFTGISIFITQTKISLIALGVLAAFVLIYFIITYIKKRQQPL